MKTRSLLLIFLLFSCVIASNAGDICTFVNLGFSPDSKNFMFGTYGVHSKENLPYSEAYLVDVKANRFLPGGQLATTGQKPATLGQDGSGALYNILHTIKPQIDRYRIDHLELGRLVYVLVNGQDAKPNVSFRDFNTETQYDLVLNQKSRPVSDKSGATVSTEAEFSISLTITPKDGKPATMTVGKAGFYRESVDAYLIRQILLSPDETSLLFVIEKQNRSKGSLQTAYMVETISLK
jgi:predicted secreted protein